MDSLRAVDEDRSQVTLLRSGLPLLTSAPRTAKLAL